jgi:hypothetical protein
MADFSGNNGRTAPDSLASAQMQHRDPKTYRLSADYGCSPVWERQGRDYVNVDIATLDLPPMLLARLKRWIVRFEATYDAEQPERSGFAKDELAQAFDDEGRDLASALESYLGDATVHYLLCGRVRSSR